MTELRILIVEDHPIARAGIESMISLEADMRVIGCAANGQEAIALFRSLQPDLTLMDLALPDMDGVEAMSAIRRTSPEARFLVLSALYREQDVLRAVKAGASGYLFKSAASTELLGAIRAVGAGLRYLPTDVATQALAALRVDDLTVRELQILNRIVAGDENAAIATALHIDPGTVKNHVHHILDKLGARTRSHAAAIALRSGLVKPPDA